MKVTFSFDNLVVVKGADTLPLSDENLGENCHIHGGFRFLIGGRPVPYLGYFGPQDVCFSDWFGEFDRMIKQFDSADETSYTYDEGEQGQPAFLFEKTGHSIKFSIVDSDISDGEGDPDWQKIEFSYDDFKQQYSLFKESFIGELRKSAPAVADKWIARSITG